MDDQEPIWMSAINRKNKQRMKNTENNGAKVRAAGDQKHRLNALSIQRLN